VLDIMLLENSMDHGNEDLELVTELVDEASECVHCRLTELGKRVKRPHQRVNYSKLFETKYLRINKLIGADGSCNCNYRLDSGRVGLTLKKNRRN
jgi:hypothetical protein